MTDPAIPLIDIAPFGAADPAGRRAVAAAVDRACRDIGFLVVAGHGVPDALVARAFAAASAFFALPVAVRRRYRAPDPGVQRGYVALGEHALAYTRGGASPPDLNERFRFGRVDVPDDAYHAARRDRFFQPNIWPAEVAGFEAALSDYYRAMAGLAATLMRIFAVALDLPADFFAGKIDRHVTVCAINHYPPQAASPLPDQQRAGAHTDYGSLTVLKVGDGAAGLQVQHPHSGAWCDVLPVPGAFIVNVGDLMAQWTNDRWVSTVHRVVNPVGAAGAAARQSIAFFHQPNEDAPVACLPGCCSAGNPPKYLPTTSGAHLLAKVARQRPPAPAR